MAYRNNDFREEYEEVKRRYRGSNEHFRKGQWFAELIEWLLHDYSTRVDAAYIRERYPGADPTNQARKAIKLAAKYNGLAGAATATAITALELASAGPQAFMTVPAIATAVFVDVSYTTRTQLRTAYDLSVIHGAPLAMDDVEDCYLMFLIALGAKVHDALGGAAVVIGPKVVAYNVRRLLRAGLRAGFQKGLQRLGGSWLAKTLTERAAMRLLVPGIGVPIAYAFNYVFTKRMLTVANRTMMRRGKVIQPVVRMHSREKSLPKTTAIKILICIVDAGDPESWGEEQMNALRYCQQTLCLTDEELADLDTYFDRRLESVLVEFSDMTSQTAADLLELALVAAALFPDSRHDDKYAGALSLLAARSSTPQAQIDIARKLPALRASLL